MLYSVIQCYTVLYSVIKCYTVLYSVIQCYTAKKWMQFYPKKENDLTQKLRRPHRKMKMTSHKNEDDLTSAKNLRDLPNKRRRPYPKNEGDLTQK